MKSLSEKTMFAILAITIIIFLGVASYRMVFPVERDDSLNFNITGITNSVNASTIASLHFECIKYCTYQFSDGTQGQYKCYEQCASLGKEACE